MGSQKDYGGNKMTYIQFQILLLLWKSGLVDRFSVFKVCVNCGSQYLGVVVAFAAGNFSEIEPKILLEPVLGFGTSYKFVQAAATVAEKKSNFSFFFRNFSKRFESRSDNKYGSGSRCSC